MNKFNVNDYRINFWNYMDSHLQGAEMVDVMHDMGCNMYMSPEHKMKPHGIENMRAVLKRCEELNMACMVFDHRVTLKTYFRDGEEKYIENLKLVYEDYKDFPAAEYCFVHDEPDSDEDFEGVFRTFELMRKYMPTIKPFVALNHVGMKKENEAVRILDRFCDGAKPDFLLYNCYSQCLYEEEDKTQGLENYFHNLKKFIDAGKRYSIPVWQSILLCGHMCIADPTQEQLRWQLNVGAAHGVTGFFWFHPIELHYSYDFRGYAIDCRGNKTPRYNQVAYESFRFMSEVASKLRDYRHEETLHLHMGSTDFRMFYPGCDDVIEDLDTLHNRPLVVGKFRHKTDPDKRAVMLVNGSQTEVCYAYITLKGEKEKIKDKLYLSAGTAKIYEL